MNVIPPDSTTGLTHGTPLAFVPPVRAKSRNTPAQKLEQERREDDYLARLDATLARAEQMLDHLQDPRIDVPVSVVMPVYNERATIEQVIQRVLAVAMPLELIVVDDCSTDGTRERLVELAERLPIRLLLHKRNLGKGAALRTGFAAAGGEVVAVQDADLEYDPAELPVLVKPIAAGCCDVVYGSRYLAPLKTDPSRLHRFGNRMLTGLSNLLTGQNLTDMETCYKVMRRSAIQDIILMENGFGCEPELTAKLARRGLRIYELPISYQSRGYADGKKIGLRDGLRAVWCIFRYACAD